jgi:hypothetical protein
MLDSAEFDSAAYVDQMAIALNLPIAPEHRSGLVLEFPLSEDIVAAPAFQPFQP